MDHRVLCQIVAEECLVSTRLTVERWEGLYIEFIYFLDMFPDMFVILLNEIFSEQFTVLNIQK